jgi:hydroxypyruvate reductase
MHASRFLTASLRQNAWGDCVCRILASAIQAVEPKQAVHSHLVSTGTQLLVSDRTYRLEDYQRIIVIGAGKAGSPMALAIEEIIPDHKLDGLVIVKEGYLLDSSSSRRRIELVEAGHPIPDSRGVDGAYRIINMLKQTNQETLVIFLISGGGSALLVLPVEGVSLQDLQLLTAQLLGCGASINEINTLRKHLDRVKGGNLARLAAPAQVISLILSDVVADPLDVIASGPTFPDQTTFQEAIQILEQYQIMENVPSPIQDYLLQGQKGNKPENPRPSDPIFHKVHNLIIASNQQAAQAALNQAHTEGLNSLLFTTYLQGEASQAGRFVASLARQIARDGQPIPRPACIIFGGETTVTVTGNGKGGRNQELALGAVCDLADLPDVVLVSLATDGGDGPTDAAGAVVTGETLTRANQVNLSPFPFLANNDAYHFFHRLDDLIITGPTNTNVNDLVFLFAF